MRNQKNQELRKYEIRRDLAVTTVVDAVLGLTISGWRSWFRSGTSGAPQIQSELWFIREYAADQQSPISPQSVFLRFDQADAFVRNFELQGFVNGDLYDGSGSVQIEGDYYLSNHWTVGGLIKGTFGAGHCDFGSASAELLIQLKVARYL